MFAHLKLHTEYSLVDSVIRIDPLFKKAQQSDIIAVAITDSCNLFAAIKFYKKALQSGVKPLFGVDLDVVNGEQSYPLTLLAENDNGYLNIVKLISEAYLDAKRVNGVPQIPKSWLTSQAMQGVIALSGGLKGELGQALLNGDENHTDAVLSFYLETFSKASFVIELERIGHSQTEQYIALATRLASEHDLSVVATNAVRFLEADDYEDHEIRVGIHQGYTLLDEARMSQYTDQQYFRSADEMQILFADIPIAIENSVIIAQRCNVKFELGNACLPQFDIPDGMTEGEYFAHISYKGLEERFRVLLYGVPHEQHAEIIQTYRDRLQIEIDVICQMGFPGYFLIVADFIQWSKDHHIPVGPGRGSGAGSLVAYALKITDIDPIPYGLLFERFLNPERVSMPDFDIDFCIEGRDRVIEYVAQKYGEFSVSQIITYGTMAAKAVVRDVGRVLGQPYGAVDRIAKLIPKDLGIKLSDAFVEGSELYEHAQNDEAAALIIEKALKLEGLTRNVGKHAAGVVISPTVLTDFTPTYCEEGSRALVTQFDKKDVEEVGLVKFDFLGLRNLTIIDHTLKLVNDLRISRNEEPIDMAFLNMQDAATFRLLQAGQTTGVFQLESHGMKELIKKLKPDCFEDIIALVALYRPGPLGSGMVDDFVNRKHGRQAVVYPHPKLEMVLKETYGTILYQEQVMQIAQILANYSLGGADILRRAMGKKDPKEMAQQRAIFEEGAKNNGIDAKLATSIFDTMEEFAKYGFNKSHSAAYALVSYQTAWLKAHYPAAFMVALLSSDMDKTDKVVNFFGECKNLGLLVKPPHVNHSKYAFQVASETEIIYGLGAIKGLGEGVIQHIVEERQRGGEYQDIFDFCCRVDGKKVNKRALESLTYAGALDGLASNRASVFASLDVAVKAAEQKNAMAVTGQSDLFGLLGDTNDCSVETEAVMVKDWGLKVRLQYEKQVLGMYLSGHVIDEDKMWLSHFNIRPLNQLTPSRRKESTLLAGSVVAMMQRKTKRGDMMGVFTIDDGFERIEMVVFSELYEQIKRNISIDDVVLVDGEISIDSYNESLRVSAKMVEGISDFVDRKVKGLSFSFTVEAFHSDAVQNYFNQVIQMGCARCEPKLLKVNLQHADYQYTLVNDALHYSPYAVSHLAQESFADMVKPLPIGD